MLKKLSIFWLVVLSAGIFYSQSAAAQSSPRVGGVYHVTGTNPAGKGSYQGTATITKQGEQYLVHWQVGTVYDGIGTLKGTTFNVEWGTTTQHVGTVTYQVASDGSMRGTWYTKKDPNSLGTEVLIPRK